MEKKKGARRKTIRYFRWAFKAVFLLIFTLPIVYFLNAPALPVYSFFEGLNKPLLAVPYGQSVCSMLLFSYDYVGPGAWLICPVGGLQALLTGKVEIQLLLSTIVALLIFLIPIFVLGNVFCGWVCPLGTLIDGFDKAVERFIPTVNMKREERFQQNKAKEEAKYGSIVCSVCPFARLLGSKNVTVANSVLVTALVGSAVLRFPVFCTICPIGVATKGMFHLKALTSVTGRMMPILVELWAIPVVAILASLREKRYFCRKICPVGASLNIAGSFSPLIKPAVKTEKCVMKGCPKTCEDYRLDYCSACRQIDQKRCERVCPQGINLLSKGSLAKCTKCLECYIQCEYDAIEIKLLGESEAISSLKRFLKGKLKRKPKDACAQLQ